MTNLLKDLEAVALLAEKATPGKWRCRPEDGVVILGGNCGGFSIEHCPDASSNAKLITAAINFLRTHHAEIAEALADARRWREVKRLTGKSVGGRGVAFEMHFEPLSIKGGTLTDYIDAAIDAQHNSAREG
jgi:hypothetical protein